VPNFEPRSSRWSSTKLSDLKTTFSVPPSIIRDTTMQTEHLKITGMTCGGCTSNVTHALEALSGVKEVEVSLARAEATVRYDELLTSPDRLKSAVTAAGYGVEVSNPTDNRPSKGGCCA
jgi:copper chaperone